MFRGKSKISMRTSMILSFLLILPAFAASAMAAQQTVAVTPASSSQLLGGSNFTLAVDYNADDTTKTGIGVRIHYDSSKLTWQSFSNVFATGKISQDALPQTDTANYDGNASTDKFLLVAWLDFTGNWPNTALPITLYNVTFSPTGKGTSPVNITFSSTHSSQPAEAVNATVTVSSVPTQLKVTSAALNQIAGVKGAMTVELQDADGDPAAPDSDVVVSLASDSGAASFYNAAGDTVITSVTIPGGNSSASFKYADETAGTPTVTLSATGYTAANQNQTITPAALAALTINPSGAVSRSADQNQQFTITGGQDQFGNTVAFGTITWSGGTGVGNIDANTGLFNAMTVGTGTVTATSSIGGVSVNSGTITVTHGAVNTLIVAPTGPQTISADNNNFQFTVTATDADGNAIPGADIGAVTWASSNTTTGTISNAGVFEAKKVGTATVTATHAATSKTADSGTITVTVGALASLTVAPGTANLTADQTQQFTVTGADADGNAVIGGGLGTITWSGGTGIGTINANSGLFTATTVGIGSVTATSSLGIMDQSGTVTVTPGAAAAFTLSSNRTKVASGGKGTATLTVTILDADGNTVTTDTGRTVNFAVTGTDISNAGWTSNSATTTNGVATIDFTTTGTVGGSGSATVTVTASSAGLSDQAVNLDIVNFSINVTAPAAPLYNAGTGVHVVTGGGGPNTAAFAGVGGDVGSYRWALTGVGSISSSTADTVTYTAPTSVTGVSETATLTLTHATDANLTDTITITAYKPVAVTYPTSTIAMVPGNTAHTVTATGGTGNYAYQSQSTGVATVAANGQITAVAAGITTIRVRDASYGDFTVNNGFRSVTAGINVVNPIVIAGKPANDAMASGTTITFTATGGLAGTVIWSVTGGGSITQAGVFTAPTVDTGTQVVTITAYDTTYNASHATPIKTDYQVTVFGALAVTPSYDIGLVVGDTFNFTAGGGNAAAKANTWTSSNDTVGTVAEDLTDDTKATFTALSAGTATVTVQDNNALTANSGTITVVAPIVVSVAPNFSAIESGGTATFSATGGTGTYVWAASAGAITANGVFTAPAVTTGNQVITVTAYDGTFNKTHDTPIKTDFTITVYPVIKLMNPPEGYIDGQPKTYPLLAYGLNTTLTAADVTRTYDWSVADWTDTAVPAASATGQTQFVVDPDALFAASGAGVYTITIKDNANNNLQATFKVRVGMKIAPMSQNLTDAAGTIAFTVTGGPVGNVFNWVAKDLSGTAVTNANAGALANGSPTGSTNTFNITNGIPAQIGFRVTASLDTAQASSNTEVKRLIDAGLDSVMSQIFRIAPVLSYKGTVVEEDGATPVPGATVTALNDATITATTAADGTFSIGPFTGVGVTYKFVITATSYLDKIVLSSDLSTSQASDKKVVLKALGAGGGAITGDVDLSNVGTGNAPETFIKVKADGSYITDDAGTAITVMAANNGNFTFPVPGTFADAAAFTVEARKRGYIFGSFEGGTVLHGIKNVTNTTVPPAALALNAGTITLTPVTVISAACTAGPDVTADGVADSVDCAIIAGYTPDPTTQTLFSNTAAEAQVTMGDGSAVTLNWDAVNTAWTFNHPTYENIKFTVLADVSETPHDVATAYKATLLSQYVKSATAPKTTLIANPNINGGSGASGSGKTRFNLPPGGLTGDVVGQVAVAIVEANASGAGATKVTGSQIVDIKMTDEDGNKEDNANLQRLEITLTFDPTVVTEGSLESGAFVIYQADSMEDMVAGNFTAISTSQIIPPVDYTNGEVTFWVDHLSAFGIGSAISSALGGGGSGGGCFITTATDGPGMSFTGAGKTAMLLVAVMLGLAFTVIRRKR